MSFYKHVSESMSCMSDSHRYASTFNQGWGKYIDSELSYKYKYIEYV